MEWLAYLQLQKYTGNFVEKAITGADLIKFSRARYTQLGVTKVGDRQKMEQWLKNHTTFSP